MTLPWPGCKIIWSKVSTLRTRARWPDSSRELQAHSVHRDGSGATWGVRAQKLQRKRAEAEHRNSAYVGDPISSMPKDVSNHPRGCAGMLYKFLPCPVQLRTSLMNLTSWTSWHLEAGGQLIVFQPNSAMIIADNSVSWQGLPGWFLCSMWCLLALSWGWRIPDGFMHVTETSAEDAGIAGDWLHLSSIVHCLVI